MGHMDNILTEFDELNLLLNGAPEVIEKVNKKVLLYEDSIAIRDIKLMKENRSR